MCFNLNFLRKHKERVIPGLSPVQSFESLESVLIHELDYPENPWIYTASHIYINPRENKTCS